MAVPASTIFGGPAFGPDLWWSTRNCSRFSDVEAAPATEPTLAGTPHLTYYGIRVYGSSVAEATAVTCRWNRGQAASPIPWR